MKALHTAFIRLTNTDSWEAAQELYPHFATDDQLHKYIHIDLKKAVPQAFSDFCQRAKMSTCSTENTDQESSLVVRYGTVSAVIIESNRTEISSHRIRMSLASFRGANLVLTSVEDVCVKEDIESLAYTIKEVNSVSGLHMYTATIVCSPSKFPLVQEVWEKAFINTTSLYAANTSLHRHSVTSLTPCVSVVVIGLFATDDVVKPDHFVYDPADKRLNSITVDGPDKLFEYIVNHFSHANSVILDITSSEGTATAVALASERNAICVVHEVNTSRVMEKLHQLPEKEQ